MKLNAAIRRVISAKGLPLLLGAVYLAVLFMWEYSVASAIQEVESASKKQQIDDARLIQRMVQRQAIVDTILQDIIDDRISLDEGALQFRDVAKTEPATLGFICVHENSTDPLEACQRHLLRMKNSRIAEKLRTAEQRATVGRE